MATRRTTAMAIRRTATEIGLITVITPHVTNGSGRLARTLVRDRRLRVRRVGRVLLDAADEIERGVQRLVILRIRRDVGLRAGLLGTFGLEVSAQRSFAARVGARCASCVTRRSRRRSK
jgi:hypothetical protein